ncbi:MAG: hypothetical protein NC421_09395 [Lachnospiraceae bacterium]|nr:hypothetical protein [Lachnospiraceae bacterium]
MGSIFSETRMLDELVPLINELPLNQKFQAGIHGIMKKVVITRIYRNAILSDDNVIMPTAEDSILFIRKSKICDFDAYIGITQDWLLVVPCNEEKWAYESFRITEPEMMKEYLDYARSLESPLPASYIIPVIPLESIAEFSAKKNWIGAYVCKLVMSDGDEFKMMLPRLGGLGGGMPNHKEYRELIVSMLTRSVN